MYMYLWLQLDLVVMEIILNPLTYIFLHTKYKKHALKMQMPENWLSTHQKILLNTKSTWLKL